LLRRLIIGYADDRASGNIWAIIFGHVDGGGNEVWHCRLIELLNSRADVGDRKRFDGELGDDAKVVSSALQSPEKVRVGRRVCDDLCAVSENNVVANHVVHGHAILVNQIVESTNQFESGNSNSLEAATDTIQAEFGESRIDVNPSSTGTNFNSRIVAGDFDIRKTV